MKESEKMIKEMEQEHYFCPTVIALKESGKTIK
jgi:hypothetical protein